MADTLDADLGPCAYRWNALCLRYLLTEYALNAARERLRQLPDTKREGQALALIGQTIEDCIAGADEDEARCR